MTPALQVFDEFDQGSVEALDDVLRRLHRTDSEGFNALDIFRVGTSWPMLSVLVNRDRCVVHRADSTDGPLYTLEARRTLDGLDLTPFKYEEGIVDYTREYVHPLATGEAFIRAFANQQAWPEGPVWVVL
jgi:hypothetical protein